MSTVLAAIGNATLKSDGPPMKMHWLDSVASVPKGEKVKEKMTTKLYVGNLSFETSSNDLETLFAKAGTVQSVSLIEDRETGRSRGFGFVEMQTKEEGDAAIAQFNGTELAGRTLKVNEAKPRENRSSGGGGGFGGGSRY